ncbi:hypothetical protein N752_17805 [Desulforamulus aquiferis]|nr:RDD family protein [Desulforamulus aquiferis]RYD03938.1 hypothetical protein N752_17805 [Desulforamulus aquiferis]
MVLLNYLWDGQTVGKRFMKIRVVSYEGGKLNIFHYLIRELTFNLYPIYLLTHSWIKTGWTIWMIATILLILQYGRGLHDMFGRTKVITEAVEADVQGNKKIDSN